MNRLTISHNCIRVLNGPPPIIKQFGNLFGPEEFEPWLAWASRTKPLNCLNSKWEKRAGGQARVCVLTVQSDLNNAMH